MGKNKKWKVATGAFLGLTLLIIYFVNRQVPFILDDLWYSTNLVTGEPLKNFGDVIESQVWHFNHWGGRSVSHFFLQLILMRGEAFADILNVIVTVVLAWLMCKTADAKAGWGILAAICMLIGLNGDFCNTMFWQSGALNYLYLTCFLLAFLWCFLREEQDDPKGIVLWILPLGLIAGWSNENMGPAVWVISLLVILSRIYTKQKVKIWMILGNLSCLVGSVLVVIAPGNFVRSNEVALSETKGTLWQMFLRCYSECAILFQSLFYAVMLMVVLGIVARVYFEIEFGKRNWMLLLGAALSWGAMILSPHYPVRASFGTLVFILCIILSLLQKMLKKEEKTKYLIAGLVIMTWLRAMFLIGQYLAGAWGWL